MLSAIRFTPIVACVLLVGCNRFAEHKLLGAWRAEDDTAVGELALREDHSFISWNTSKTEFSTPNVIVETGNWRVRRNQIEMKAKTTNSVKPSDSRKFRIVKIRDNELLVRSPENKIVALRRLDLPICSTAGSGYNSASLETDIVGSWQIHYNTHDYELSFNKDHTCADSARVEGVLKQFHTGTWRTEGNDVNMHMKSVPLVRGAPDDEFDVRWIVTASGPQCFAIKVESIPYVLKRMQ